MTDVPVDIGNLMARTMRLITAHGLALEINGDNMDKVIVVLTSLQNRVNDLEERVGRLDGNEPTINTASRPEFGGSSVSTGQPSGHSGSDPERTEPASMPTSGVASKHVELDRDAGTGD